MSISIMNYITSEQVYVFPASFMQEGLWFLDQLNSAGAAYNLPVALHLRGYLDVESLQRSLNTIVQRHESLRTTFRLVEGQLVQIVAPRLIIPLSVVNLEHLPEVEQKVESLRLATEEVQLPFDLIQGPLLRITVLHLGTEEHVLLLTMHHIISDGWSIGVLFRELTALYKAFSADEPFPLPELPIQYADFALWQRDMLQEDVLARHLTYWKQQLAGMPERLNLPTDRPHLPSLTSRGASYRLRLSKGLTNDLKELSLQQGVTLYMTLVAAFQTLLCRYSGQEDVVIGTVSAGRTQVEAEALIGFFANTLVLRTDLSGNPSFQILLERVRKVVLEAQSHQDLPFEFLVKELHPERQLGQNPLFQVMLTLTPPLSGSPLLLVPTPLVVETGTAKFDLSLEVVDHPEGLLVRFEYSTELFDEATIASMANHWQRLLGSIVADPTQPLMQLPLLTEKERHRILVEWNTTERTIPINQCVHQLFEAQVERTPESIALIFEKLQLTYHELNVRANQLAHYLRALGVGPEVLVGLCMERSLDMIVALLGILKAGGAYVPLDPAYPKERLAFMLQDTQAPVLVTQEGLFDLPPKQGTYVLCLDKEWKTIKQQCSENPVSGTNAENLAYVMYTSGSTGRPKGVEVKHRSIIRLLFGVDYVHLDATQTLLHMAPISFDAATFEIWGALLHGARCVLFPGRIPTPAGIGAIVRKHDVTIAWLTASLFNAVIDEAPDALVGIRQLLTGGEVLSVTHVRHALDLLPTTQLINGYGPTESTTFTCCYPIPKRLSKNLRSIPIGTPIGNTQVYILDRHLNPVPIGVPGELHVGGVGLARGYLNRPELTAEKFIANPFNAESSACLYKTGDLVRYLSDGNIEFLGRLDEQVKIRGFRIELDEVREILSQHTAVQEAFLTHEDERSGQHIVAYAVLHQGQSVTPDELRGFLREQLPAYMIPSDFMLLDSLPLTPNGKVNRSALPTLDAIRSSVKETYAAPTSIMHYQLVQIWEELLDVRPIGIRDNFFYLGGHSLLAARLVDRIEQSLGKKVPFATLFAGPTISDLTNALQTEVGHSSPTSVIALEANGSKRPFFYLHGTWNSQAFYCFSLARHLGPDQPFYVLEPYQFDDLQTAPTIETIAKAHIESMRTVQPEGPYLLGGFCNGGLIAYEMARQLQTQGEQVALLILVDPAYPPMLHKLTWNVLTHIGSLLGFSLKKPLEWFMRLRHMYKYVRHERNSEDFKEFRAVNTSILTLFPTADTLHQDNIAISNWMVAGYSYGLYSGKATLFRACEEALGDVWQRKVAQGEDIEVQTIPGNHISCRTDHVQAFAEQLRICLEKVQAAELRA